MARKKKGEWLAPSSPEADPMRDYARRLNSYSRRFMTMPSRYLDLFMQTSPDIDLIDEGSDFRVRADLPGVDKNDIKLSVNKNRLTISAKTRKRKEERKQGYYYSERSAANYYRSIPLPSEVMPKTAKAKLENGTLEITVKKVKGGEGKSVRVD